jgi:hypothetical protein
MQNGMISCYFFYLEFDRVAYLSLGGIERLRPVLKIKGDLSDFQYYKQIFWPLAIGVSGEKVAQNQWNAAII